MTVSGNLSTCPCYVFASSPSGVYGFSTDADTGQLAALPGNPAPAGAGPGPIATLTGWVYVVNTTDGTITGYATNGIGNPLIPITGPVVKAGRGPTSIIVIPRPSVGPVG